jgi:hypothetical protein
VVVLIEVVHLGCAVGVAVVGRHVCDGWVDLGSVAGTVSATSKVKPGNIDTGEPSPSDTGWGRCSTGGCGSFACHCRARGTSTSRTRGTLDAAVSALPSRPKIGGQGLTDLGIIRILRIATAPSYTTSSARPAYSAALSPNSLLSKGTARQYSNGEKDGRHHARSNQ